jgi:hypothetical protein
VRARLGRRRVRGDHPGLKHVDKLLSGHPEELEVHISGLPGRLAQLFSIYEALFALRGYQVTGVDRHLDDLWIARVVPTHRSCRPLPDLAFNASTEGRMQ